MSWWISGLLLIQFMMLMDTTFAYRLPAGHDGFQYFGLQYYFLNNAIMTGEVPQWMPFMTQGTVASWWYAVSTSIMQGVYFLIAPLLKGSNFLDLFAIGIFVDHVLLLLGCWCWSGYYLKSYWARFIFCAAVMMTTAWWLQPWHNFHAYYALPMIFYFWHMWRQWGHGVYAFLCFSLLLLQMLGQMPYQAPWTVFVVAVYAFIVMAIGRHDRYVHRPMFRFSYRLIAWAILAFILSLAYANAVSFGTQDIVSYNVGRLSDGKTSLDTFLHYGGNLSLNRLKEWWLGISPEMDYTLYLGLWLMPVIIWGLCFVRSRKFWSLVVMLVLMLDFSHGGITAHLTHVIWPGMKYFRHISLTVVVSKLLMALLATISLEAWLKGEHKWRGLLVVGAVIVLLSQLVVDRDVYDQLMISMTDWGRARLWYFEDLYKPFLNNRLLALKVLSALYVVIFSMALWLKPNRRHFAIIALVILVLVDLGLYYRHETKVRSYEGGRFVQALNFQPMTFYARRINQERLDNPRQQLLNALPIQHHPYWSNETFTMTDRVDHPGRTDHWLKSFDRLLRAYWKKPDDDFKRKSNDINLEVAFKFPLTHPASQVWSGYSADKLMLFDRVARCPDQSMVAFFMVHPDYRGYVPFIVDQGNMFACLENLLADRRLPLTWYVTRFDANHLWVGVRAPKTGWLSFADVWHPAWRATVDGIKLPVAKVNLAYKMVAVEQGQHQVHFDFYNNALALAQRVLSLLALGWLVMMVLMIAGHYRQD